jgi:hypothetical protein
MEKLICEICYSCIGAFDPDAIYQPITGAMITSPNPRREVPSPFATTVDWEHMRCPVCRTRPIIKPYRLMIGHPRCFQTPHVEATYFEVPEAAAPSGSVAAQLVDDAAQGAAQPDDAAQPAAESEVQAKGEDEAAPPAEDNAEEPDESVACPTCGKRYTSQETLERYHTPCPKLAQGNED